MTFIVELETGTWLAETEGDPGRTKVQDNAQRFESIKDAYDALDNARKHRPFEAASVLDETVFF